MKIKEINRIDKKLNDIEKEFNFFLFLTPVNKDEEQKIFFNYYKKGCEYNPKYRYKTGELKKIRHRLNFLLSDINSEDKLFMLFRRKINNMFYKLDLVESFDNDFPELCRKLYGIPDKRVMLLARKILKNQFNVSEEETIESLKMVAILRNELEKYKIKWKVKEKIGLLSKVLVSSFDETIYVNANCKYTKGEAARLSVHEMVHVFRSINGEKQPWHIFKTGLANYKETEEGLAVYVEDIKGKLRLDSRQLKIYAGRVLAIEIALKNSFFKTFCILKEKFSETLSYYLTERVKRGMCDTSKPGAFTKDFYYLSGWQKIKEYIKGGGDINILYAGKIGVNDVSVIEYLMNKGILFKPEYIL